MLSVPTIKVKTLKIAGGNSTALIYNCPKKLRKKISKKYLREVEQVGFVYKNKLIMSGGELCINATLALASQLLKKGVLFTSGIKKPWP